MVVDDPKVDADVLVTNSDTPVTASLLRAVDVRRVLDGGPGAANGGIDPDAGWL